MAGVKPFREFSELSEATLRVLDRLGYSTATPVQEACLPLFIGHKDVAVDACTGSGKTLAFVVPIIEKLLKLEDQLRRNEVSCALFLAPTLPGDAELLNQLLTAGGGAHRVADQRAGQADLPGG